jgi:hypothetical protein
MAAWQPHQNEAEVPEREYALRAVSMGLATAAPMSARPSVRERIAGEKAACGAVGQERLSHANGANAKVPPEVKVLHTRVE